jgi:tetratricopeptide (TPR) repeat protein
MIKAWWANIALLLAVAGLGCATGRGPGAGKVSEAAARLASEASSLAPIASEEDLLEAKFIYQALAQGSDDQSHLRLKMVEYLLGPLAKLDAGKLRRTPGLLGSDDDFDRVQDSLRDALELYPAHQLWRPEGLVISARERELLSAAAHLVVDIYSPRGNEQPVAMGLFLLQTLEPKNPEWPKRIDQVFGWLETQAKLAMGGPGPRTQPTMVDLLDAISTVWPSPQVVERLAGVASQRQKNLSEILRRPTGTGTNSNDSSSILRELLVDSEALSAMGVGAASLFLRCGQMDRAAKVLEGYADKPGDDPELRKLLANINQPSPPPSAYLTLARRFLPRSELLLGTSQDRLDPAASGEILRRGLLAYPHDSDMLVLASRVSRLNQAPFLALRLLDEALLALKQQNAAADKIADISAERIELAFLRLRSHIDPERIQVALRDAETLRARLAQDTNAYGASHFKLKNADIDLLMARGLVDAGNLDQAEPLLARAQSENSDDYEITLQTASLVQKRGNPERAAQILRAAIDARQAKAPAEETVGFVEGQSRLSYALGTAYEVLGAADEARKAWRVALRGWERLMIEQLRRKNLSSSAGATFEVGRLYYLLGRREEGLRRFDEAIEQDESRDQSYIDTIAFLVQRGDAEPAQDVYRRALSKSNRVVSEYVKVYSSVWILDLTRRRNEAPDATAMDFLRTLDARQIDLRPARAAAWYRQLVRFALGRISYEAFLAMADSPGKRAEVFFYEAMRRLADGKSNDANELWTKVIQTNMASFFEFEMASRYLRTGAPTSPRPAVTGETI